MKLAAFFFIVVATSTAGFAAGVPGANASDLLSRVPLRFEPNKGQVRASEPVAWTARNPQAAYAFTADGALIRTQNRIVRLRMEGANPKAAYQAMDALPAPANYVTAAYRGSVPGFGRLRRSAVYPGIDLVYYGKGTALEYDFEVAPGADPSRIRLKFEGAAVRVNEAGDLVLGDPLGALGHDDKDLLVQRAPVVYQLAADGTRQAIASRYLAAADGTVTMALAHYDKSTKLVIDPTIIYTQYFLGSNASPAVAVTHDAQGFVYVAGNTQATDFYIQGNYAFLGNNGSQDAWIMKINPVAPDGNFVPFSTYYGGSLNEIVEGIAVDNNGIAYIAGVTQSTDLPTSNPYTSTLPGLQSTFVAGFDTVQATFIYGTYLGGTVVDYCQAIAYSAGSVYVTGYSTSPDYPVTAGAIETTPRGGEEVFVAQLNPALGGTAQLVASTFLPGSGDDQSRAIAVDSAGFVYVGGETGSPDFAVTANGVDTVYDQAGDGFLVKLNLQIMQVLYGTYLGGSGYDEIRSVVVEPGGHIGVAGYTTSTDFPTTQNAYQTQMTPNSYAAAFLSIVDPAASPGSPAIYSTVFNGNFAEIGYSAARDNNGLYYISGYTLSSNLPMGSKPALNPTSAGGGLDGFVAQIDPTLGINGLIYSSYITGLGNQIASGVDVDANGIVYVVGWSTADIFPPGFAIAVNPGVVTGFMLAFKP
jgi:hypothetical protein